MSVQGEFFEVPSAKDVQIEPEAEQRQRRSLRDFVIPKLYRSISEISAMTGIEQYVLRYWESEFDELRPQKNRAGNRIYSDKDVRLIVRIKELLRDERYTIDGAKKIIKEELEIERRKKLEEMQPKPIKDEAQIPMITPPPPTQIFVDIKKIEELKSKLLTLRSSLSR